MTGDQAQAPHDAAATAPTARGARLVFTGTGAEYFRIWIVNLLLTIVTLGIYSAWAKVRKMQYFYRNTQLDGSGFDYHGRPVAILKGRILAVVLVGAYQIAMRTLGPLALVAIVGLIAGLPWLLTQSYRFRLHNSSYRGLRFRFHGPVSQAYLIFGLPMLAALVPGALAAAGGIGDPRHPDKRFFIIVAGLYLVLMILWPYLHFCLKRWQHGHAQFGQARARFDATAWDFYALYLVAGLMMLGIGVFGAILIALFAGASSIPGAFRGVPSGIFVSMLAFYCAAIAVGTLLSAWIQNMAWSSTRLESIAISSDLRGGRLIGITLTNVLLIVFSLGLLIPFAVIRSMKYRLESIKVLDADALATIGRAAEGGPVAATGEGAMDVLDLDFGL